MLIKHFLLFSCFLTINFCFAQDVALTITDKAIEEMQNENYSKAIILFDKAISKNSKDVEAYRYRAVTKYRLKNYSGALSDINTSIKLDSTSAESYEIRADIKYRLNDLKGCIIDYEKAVSINPIYANNEDRFYEVAKSKLATKSKPNIGAFQPSIAFIEKVINTKLNFTDFYNQFFDNILSYTDANSLTYNEETKEHDKPEYTADIIMKYKGAEITFSVTSKTDKDPITAITISAKCTCEWFRELNSISSNSYSETKRDDNKKGALQIWGTKKIFDIVYYSNVKTLERYVMVTKKK